MRSVPKPRLLRLLRIDDDIPGGNLDPSSLDYRHHSAPDFLETVLVPSDDEFDVGIRNWVGALNFWREFQRTNKVDLVLSDVRFGDESSPLNSLSTEGVRAILPTGLSHFKAFATIARYSGSPIGVALHSADSQHWERSHRTGDIVSRMLSLLAAHEIGELSAILGDADGVTAGAALDGCWNWLNNRTIGSENHRRAIPIALREYRKRLGSVDVLPDAWGGLMSWCEQMKRDADSSPTGRVSLNDENDPGFEFMLADGTRECIALRSIFADVPLVSSGFDFDLTGLPSEAFAMSTDDAFFELSEAGIPRIGSLVKSCGKFAEAFDEALQILAEFPLPSDGRVRNSLADCANQKGWRGLSVGLAVLFQEIRREFLLYDHWRYLYQEAEWDPATDSFSESTPVDAMSLQRWCNQLFRRLKAFRRDDDLVPDGAFKDFFVEQRGSEAGMVRCRRMLLTLGLIKQKGSGFVRIGDRFGSEIPKVPIDRPNGFFSVGDISKLLDNEPLDVLRTSFGHEKNIEMGRKDDNTQFLRRTLKSGFGLASENDGTIFMKDFRLGCLRRPWVVELCRQYARGVLMWSDTAAWPDAIKY